MKTLLVNGSPRPHGNTAELLERLAEGLPGETVLLQAYDPRFGHCTDCRWCWQHEGCAIDDGFQAVYRLLDEVDAVVLGSPLYFSEVTGGLLNFGSRLQTYYAAKYKRDQPVTLKPKRGGLILVGGGDSTDLTKARSTARTLLKLMNAPLAGEAASLHTDDLPALQDAGALEQLAALAQALLGE